MLRDNGKYIVVKSKEELEEALETICVCGYPLRDHEYRNTYGSTKTYETGGSRYGCRQFKLKGRREYA